MSDPGKCVYFDAGKCTSPAKCKKDHMVIVLTKSKKQKLCKVDGVIR